MYEIGDLVIYGKQGVCRIENIGSINIGSSDNNKLYYTLIPMYENGRTYTPVDTEVYMRPIITLQEVKYLLMNSTGINDSIIDINNPKELMSYYKSSIDNYHCGGLLQLLSILCSKEKQMQEQGKKLGQADERYKKEAEKLLHQEFAIVLDIPKEDVMQYIKNYSRHAS